MYIDTYVCTYVCMCVHTYMHNCVHAIHTYGQQVSEITLSSTKTPYGSSDCYKDLYLFAVNNYIFEQKIRV